MAPNALLSLKVHIIFVCTLLTIVCNPTNISLPFPLTCDHEIMQSGDGGGNGHLTDGVVADARTSLHLCMTMVGGPSWALPGKYKFGPTLDIGPRILYRQRRFFFTVAGEFPPFFYRRRRIFSPARVGCVVAGSGEGPGSGKKQLRSVSRYF